MAGKGNDTGAQKKAIVSSLISKNWMELLCFPVKQPVCFERYTCLTVTMINVASFDLQTPALL